MHFLRSIIQYVRLYSIDLQLNDVTSARRYSTAEQTVFLVKTSHFFTFLVSDMFYKAIASL